MAVTWIDEQDLLDWLGVSSFEVEDQAFATTAVAAANAFCRRRREESGYTTDVDATAPNDAAKLGTTQYCGGLFRQRGSVDSYSSLDSMPPVAFGSLAEVWRLLGTNKPQVA
jgi:hypothetical protein